MRSAGDLGQNSWPDCCGKNGHSLIDALDHFEGPNSLLQGILIAKQRGRHNEETPETSDGRPRESVSPDGVSLGFGCARVVVAMLAGLSPIGANVVSLLVASAFVGTVSMSLNCMLVGGFFAYCRLRLRMS